MATATITNGFTQLNACDSATGITGNAQLTDTIDYKEGTGSQAFTLTASKKTVDVTAFINTATWSAGDQVRFWFNFALPGALATAANGGIKVELSDGTNTAFYQFLGQDNYGGGWVLGSIDISTGTILSGTRPTGTLTSIGIELTVTGVLRNATNCWVDNFHIGSGYSVYGGTSGDEIGMAEILTADLAGGWGLVQKTGGVYFINGKLNIGDDSSTNATYFLDSGNPVSFTHVGSVASTSFALTTTGNTTGVTSVKFSGFFIQGDTEQIAIDFLDSNLDALVLSGCTFKSASSVLFTSDSTHSTTNCVFDSCGQIIPLLSTFQKNTISNYVGTDGAVLWPSVDTNITDLTFIVCDNDVEVDATSDSTPTFYNVVHDDTSGDYDVNNTSGSARTVALQGTSNGNSYNTGGSTVTFVASVTIEVKNVITGSAVHMATLDANGDESTVLINEVATGTSVSDTVDYTSLDYTAVAVVVRNASGTTKYFPYRAGDTISVSGLSHTANQVENTLAT